MLSSCAWLTAALAGRPAAAGLLIDGFSDWPGLAESGDVAVFATTGINVFNT
jgi:hypothetical protein